MDRTLSSHDKFESSNLDLLPWDPNYIAGVDVLDHAPFFMILKNSGQELSNEGSNFILSSLEVGH